MSKDIPSNHPRAESLRIREKIVKGYELGIVATEGLLAHGRGEALDYMLGEKTTRAAKRAIRAAAATLLLADSPVISVNGNAAALCPREMVMLAKATGAKLEINTFYGNIKRRIKIASFLKKHGAKSVLGVTSRHQIRLLELESYRSVVDKEGIDVADVVVVPLEDGDRVAALKKAGKRVIAFDLNPLSRTARTADITIVDNLVRSITVLKTQCKIFSDKSTARLEKIVLEFDNKECLAKSSEIIRRGTVRSGNIA